MYDLWVTSAEQDAMVRILQTYPTQELLTSKGHPAAWGHRHDRRAHAEAAGSGTAEDIE